MRRSWSSETHRRQCKYICITGSLIGNCCSSSSQVADLGKTWEFYGILRKPELFWSVIINLEPQPPAVWDCLRTAPAISSRPNRVMHICVVRVSASLVSTSWNKMLRLAPSSFSSSRMARQKCIVIIHWRTLGEDAAIRCGLLHKWFGPICQSEKCVSSSKRDENIFIRVARRGCQIDFFRFNFGSWATSLDLQINFIFNENL